MKNIKILLATLLAGSIALTSCDNEEVLPPVIGGPPMLEKNMDGFTVENIEVPANFEVWTWSDQYGAVAKGSNSINTDTYLVSPPVTLSEDPVCTFSQAINYLKTPREENVNVCVREVLGGEGDDLQVGEWQVVNVDKWPAGTSWGFNDSNADISEFADKTIQMGFHYQSVGSNYCTWEIQSLRVY